jgi:UDP-N-acetylglucosamine 1-carboxyvinyltransferase
VPPIQYIVEGGQRLAGTIEPSGNKNSALPIIAAALLTEHPVTLENVPRIRDTETLVELVRSVGASAEWRSRNTLAIHAKEIRAADLDPELCARIRASILLAGPLLARCGEVALPPPGGDVIGRRRLDTHFLAFQQLGATVTATHRLEFRASRLKGADVFLDEPSVTATENALMAAVAAHGTPICATSLPSRMCRTSRISWLRSEPASKASAPTPSSCTGRRRSAPPVILSDPITSRWAR